MCFYRCLTASQYSYYDLNNELLKNLWFCNNLYAKTLSLCRINGFSFLLLAEVAFLQVRFSSLLQLSHYRFYLFI